jgi:hypothetical protein
VVKIVDNIGEFTGFFFFFGKAEKGAGFKIIAYRKGFVGTRILLFSAIFSAFLPKIKLILPRIRPIIRPFPPLFRTLKVLFHVFNVKIRIGGPRIFRLFIRSL